jgi:PRC-barrel domain
VKTIDSCTENEARRFIGATVLDVLGKKAGTLQRVWFDPSTYRPEFAGIRIGGLLPATQVVPARDTKIDEANALVRLEHPLAFVRNAPHANPNAELAEVEKEEIDAYYGYFVPLRRISDIKEIRPEDALDGGPSRSGATPDELLLRK